MAIKKFLAIDESPLKNAAEHIFEYYKFCFDNIDVADEEIVRRIASPDDVWRFIELDSEPMFTRRAYGDKGIYVSLSCSSDWENEHGLQILFRNGLVGNKVGSYKGHLTNSDAYDDDSLENVIYHS